MSEAFSFRRGDVRLQGRLHRAHHARPPAVLLLQGSPGNPEDVLGLGARFAATGHDTVTFNYSGTLGSGGLSSFSESQADIAAAWRLLRESGDLGVDSAQLVLGGWSYGGGMALTYAARHSEAGAVFSIAGTDHGAFMREYRDDPDYRRMVDEMFDGFARPDSPWRLAPGATPGEMLADGTSVDAYDLVRLGPDLVDRDVLLVGGWDDTNVKIERHLLPLYRRLVALGADRAEIVALRADHGFVDTRKELADTILGWLESIDRTDV